MGTKEKLIERLKSRPADFTFDEAARLLHLLGYQKSEKGKTSGSRVLFFKKGRIPLFLHRPHPQKELKDYAVKQILSELIKNGDLI
ncbi:MAG: type II toxin-antitoxin system HicA family toxin [Bacteroidales bacterium]|nr:type II toxin-antitoxin system HicA family toxin [Bacteroidales bacterium]